MAVTLSESKNNAQEDYDPAVIDEFRKESAVLDSLVFDDAVNPSGGGATLTYGYRRLATEAVAAFRELNQEYSPQNVTTKPYSVDLAVLGGSFEIDRVIAKVGPAASAAVALNMSQKIKAARAKFTDAIINGDSGLDANGFDGLDKGLRNTSTEFNPDTVTDWSTFSTGNEQTALDNLDEFLSLLDGTPTVLVGNDKSLARVRAAARRASMYTLDPVDGLVGQNGRPIERQTYGGLIMVDAGAAAGSNDKIIPVTSRAAKWTLSIAGGTTSNKVTLTVDGHSVDVTLTGSGVVTDNAVKTALKLLPNIDPDSVAVSSGAITFDGRLVAMSAEGDGTAVPTLTADTPSSVTDLYAYRVGLDGFHGVSTVGGQLVQAWMPDFSSAGAVKKGEVELGPVAVALKATKAAAVYRNIKV